MGIENAAITSSIRNLTIGTWSHNSLSPTQQANSDNNLQQNHFIVSAGVSGNALDIASATEPVDSNHHGMTNPHVQSTGDATRTLHSERMITTNDLLWALPTNDIFYSDINSTNTADAIDDRSPWSANQADQSNLSGRNGGGRDPVTGLKINFADIGTIRSDVVYGMNSEVGQFFTERLASDRTIEDFKAEFEFNKIYFVVTLWVSYDRPDSRGRDKETLTRMAMAGQFSYKNNRLKKATVLSMGQNWPDGVGLGGVIYTHPGQGITINRPDSYTFFGLSLSPLATVANKTHEYLDFDMDGSNDDEIIGLGERGVRNFGGGRIFYENWWDNPFASDLI